MSGHVRSAGGPRRTRAEWYADVKSLHDQGLNGLEIARRTGLASTWVYELLNDPTGERARERKQRNRGVCVDCGAATYDRKTKRCLSCARNLVAAKHGTRAMYSKHGCRCDACRAANRDAARALKGRVPPNHGHSGYVNYGCRCDVCRQGHRDYMWRTNHYDRYGKKGTVAA